MLNSLVRFISTPKQNTTNATNQPTTTNTKDAQIVLEEFVQSKLELKLIDFVKWIITIEHLLLDLMSDNPPQKYYSIEQKPDLIISPKNGTQRRAVSLLCKYYQISYTYVMNKSVVHPDPRKFICCRSCSPQIPINDFHINRTQKSLKVIQERPRITQMISNMDKKYKDI
jgi:hypothetical protein